MFLDKEKEERRKGGTIGGDRRELDED